jgi:hypothetical protein
VALVLLSEKAERKVVWATFLWPERKVHRGFRGKIRLHSKAKTLKAGFPIKTLLLTEAKSLEGLRNTPSLVASLVEETCSETMMNLPENVAEEIATTTKMNLLREAKRKGASVLQMSLQHAQSAARNSEILMSSPTEALSGADSIIQMNLPPKASVQSV